MCEYIYGFIRVNVLNMIFKYRQESWKYKVKPSLLNKNIFSARGGPREI